jgi:hypothetical protein
MPAALGSSRAKQVVAKPRFATTGRSRASRGEKFFESFLKKNTLPFPFIHIAPDEMAHILL